MKECSHCLMLTDNYPPSNKSKDGLGSWCRNCKKDLERQRRSQRGIKEKLKPVVLDDTHKECLKCNIILLIKNFRDCKRGRLKKSSYCFECEKEYFKSLKENNNKYYKEKQKVNTQRYRNKHREFWRSLHRINQFHRRNRIKVQNDGTVTEKFMINLYSTPICYWCKKKTPRKLRTAEHIIPLSKQGSHSSSNLIMACLSCNSSKLNFK